MLGPWLAIKYHCENSGFLEYAKCSSSSIEKVSAGLWVFFNGVSLFVSSLQSSLCNLVVADSDWVSVQKFCQEMAFVSFMTFYTLYVCIDIYSSTQDIASGQQAVFLLCKEQFYIKFLVWRVFYSTSINLVHLTLVWRVGKMQQAHCAEMTACWKLRPAQL